jgi:glyoxylase-like metal-dependent hydrolase (beta-lactamase superfamily II)/ferredoxin
VRATPRWIRPVGLGAKRPTYAIEVVIVAFGRLFYPSVASVAKRLSANAAGDFFVDSTCIDCEACRWIAPKTFDETGGMSRVFAQPSSAEEERRALMALVACPTASIGTERAHDMAPIKRAFPDPITSDIHHAGYHAESSFGAASYLIVRSAGNILVDSPRFSRPLVKRIEELGGIKTIFLTHRDDVADQAKFAEHFGATRILHADDVSSRTRDVEMKIEGTAPLKLDADVTLIPVPGHTEGSMCLLYRDQALFSGDHVAYDPARDRIYAFRGACWYDWSMQKESMRRLLDFRFEWILPGHSYRCHFPADEMRARLERCIAWMR